MPQPATCHAGSNCPTCPPSPAQVGTSTPYLLVSTADGNQLRLGGAQYLPAAPTADAAPTQVEASSLQPGQFIWVTDPANDQALIPSEVTQIAWATLPGHLLPLTLQGGLIVDAAQVSGGVSATQRQAGPPCELLCCHCRLLIKPCSTNAAWLQHWGT